MPALLSPNNTFTPWRMATKAANLIPDADREHLMFSDLIGDYVSN